MDHKEIAIELLTDWHLCLNAQVPKNVIDLQLVKDKCATLAHGLDQELAWGDSEEDLEKACDAFSPMLTKLKEQIVYEVLRDGKI